MALEPVPHPSSRARPGWMPSSFMVRISSVEGYPVSQGTSPDWYRSFQRDCSDMSGSSSTVDFSDFTKTVSRSRWFGTTTWTVAIEAVYWKGSRYRFARNLLTERILPEKVGGNRPAAQALRH